MNARAVLREGVTVRVAVTILLLTIAAKLFFSLRSRGCVCVLFRSERSTYGAVVSSLRDELLVLIVSYCSHGTNDAIREKH